MARSDTKKAQEELFKKQEAPAVNEKVQPNVKITTAFEQDKEPEKLYDGSFFGIPTGQKYTGKQIDDSIYQHFTGKSKDEIVGTGYSSPNPALIDETVTYSGDTILGFRPITDVTQRVDYSKLTQIPGTSIEDVLPKNDKGFTTNDAKVGVMEALGFKNKNGDRIPFLSEDTYEKRIELANKGAATSLVVGVGEDGEMDVDLDYSKLLTEKIDVELDIDDGFFAGTAGKSAIKSPVFNIPLTKLTPEGAALSSVQRRKLARKGKRFTESYNYQMIVDNGFDKELTKALFARDLNKNLINMGVKDARTRLGIIEFETNLPSVLGVGFGDAEKVSGRVVENLKFMMEATGYLAGETLGGFIDAFNDVDFADSEKREQFWTKVAPTVSRMIQRKFAQNNIQISYKIAEQLARRYSGIGSRVIAVGSDILIPSAILKKVTTTYGKKELKRYRDFSAQEKKRDGNLSDEAILEKYDTIRNRTMFGFSSSEQVNALPLVKKYGVKLARGTLLPIKRVFNGGRLTNGMQLEEAAKVAESIRKNRNLVYGPPNLKAIKESSEVSAVLLNRTRIINEAKAVQRRIDLNPNAKNVNTLEQRLKKLELQDEKVVKELMNTVARSNSPKFMREIQKVDNYMWAGASIAGQMAQESNGDPMLFEFIGMLTGLGWGMYGNISEAYNFVKNGGGYLDYSGKSMMSLKKYAQAINTFDPALQSAIIQRADYFSKLQDEIIQQGGIDVTQLQSSINRIVGLSVLHLAEEGGKHLLKESDLRKGKKLAELTENLAQQKKLVGELKRTMLDLGGPGATEGSQKFFNTIDGVIKYGEANIAQLSDDLDVISKNGALYYRGMIKGDPNHNLSVTEIDNMPSAATKMDEALNNAAKYGIKKYSVDDLAGIENQRLQNQKEIRDTVMDQAANLSLKYNNANEAAVDVAKVVDPQKLKRKGKSAVQIRSTDGAVDDGITNASDLFGILLESKHIDEKLSFTSKYNRLNGILVTPQGQKIKGTVSADGGAILDRMFEVLKKSTAEPTDDSSLLLIQRLKNSTINKGQESKIFNIIENAADSYFSKQALKSPETTSLDDWKSNAKAMMEEAVDGGTHTLIDGVSDNINLLNYIRVTGKNLGKNPQTIPFTIEEAVELRSAFGQLAFKTTNPSAKNKFNTLDEATSEMLKSGFTTTLDDGTTLRLNTLLVETTNPVTSQAESLSVLNYLRRVDDDYFNFKRRFYDRDSYVSKLMGWNTTRKYVEPNAVQNQIGLETAIPTNKWLDLDNISTLKDIDATNRGNELMAALGSPSYNTNGKLIGYVLKETLPDGSVNPDAVAFSSVLDASYGQWLAKQTIDLKTPKEIIDKSRKIASSFRVVDADGNFKEILDWRKAVDDSQGFNSTNFAEAEIKRGDDIANNAVDNIVTTQAQQIKTVRSNMQTASNVLKKYTASNMDTDSVADALLGGGSARLEEVRKSMKTLKPSLKDKDIDEALYNVVAEAVDDRTFRTTGNFSLDPVNGTIFPDLDMDIEALKKLSGFGNPNGSRAKVFNRVVGDKRSRFYKSMIEFMEMQKLDGQDMYGLKNVPRAFSLESYISRFYSIQRGVISARYVGTEAILQQYRLRGSSAFRAMLNDADAGQAFLDMVRSGKQLDPKVDRKFFNALVTGFAFSKDMLDNVEQREVNGNIISIPLKVLDRGARELGSVDVLKTDEYEEFQYPEFINLPKEKPSDDITTQMENIKRQQRRRRIQ